MKLTPVKSIRRYCLTCCMENSAEVNRCPAKDCPLHPYRMGHRPKGNGELAEDSATERHVEALKGGEDIQPL